MSFQTTDYPYDTVVRISFTVGGAPFQGSGVLISPDEVLTASHVVYTAGIGVSQNFVVTPGYNLGAKPYGSSGVTYVHYFPIQDSGDLIGAFDSQYDYAVIHLATAFPRNGTMGLLSNYAGGQVHVTGYPGSANGVMIDSTQTVTEDPNYSLLNGTSIGKGSSGGPVWIGGGANPQVVGIVSTESGSVGHFTQITGAAFHQIEAWVAADDGPDNATGVILSSASALAAKFDQYESMALAGKLVSITLTDGGTPAIPLTLAQLLADKDVLHYIGGPYIVVTNGTTIRGHSMAVAAQNLGSKAGVLDVRFADGDVTFDPGSAAARVTRLYQAALNRLPDQGGLYGWVGQITTGTALASVAHGFIGSAEFTNRFGANLSNTAYITQLYGNVLHRAPESGGVTGWLNQMGAGATREDVLVGFSDSAENRSNTAGLVSAGIWTVDRTGPQVARLYDTTLGRLPDSGGLAGWESQLDSGAMSLDQVANSFMASNEFVARYGNLSPAAFVSALYANTLHRSAGATELAGWTGQLGGGASRSSVVLGFSESAEHQANTAANILSNVPSDYGIRTA